MYPLAKMSVNLFNNLIKKSHFTEARKLIEKGNINLNQCDEIGFAPIHVAVINESVEILELILSQSNIDLNILSREGETALLISFNLVYNKKIIQKLITAGCDVNIGNREGLSPLHLAVRYSFIFEEIVVTLIENGANINATTCDDWTPLHEAVLCSNVRNVYILLYYGADCDVNYKGILTPFTWAIISKKLETALQILYEYESDYLRNVEGLSIDNVFDELIKEMAYCETDLSTLFEIIPNILFSEIANKNIFITIWHNVDKGNLLEHYSSFILNDILWNEDFIYKYQCLIDLVSSQYAFDLIEESIDCNLCTGIIHSSNLKDEEKINLIYIFLTYGVPVFFKDIVDCFDKYESNEELINAMLHAGVQEQEQPTRNNLNFDSPSENMILFYFVINYGGDFYEELFNLLKNTDYSYQRESTIIGITTSFLRIFDYCTPIKKLKDFYFDKMVRIYERYYDEDEILEHKIHKAILKRFDELDDVPSLLELSRNAARAFVYDNVKIKNFSYFTNFVDLLKIPHKIRQLIKFKLSINKESNNIYHKKGNLSLYFADTNI